MKKIAIISLLFLSACATKKPVKLLVHRTYAQVPADVLAIHPKSYHLGSSLNPCDTHHYFCNGYVHKKKDGTCFCIPMECRLDGCKDLVPRK